MKWRSSPPPVESAVFARRYSSSQQGGARLTEANRPLLLSSVAFSEAEWRETGAADLPPASGS